MKAQNPAGASAVVAGADDLALALRALLAADESGEPLDNATLASALGWDLDRVARCLDAAKDQSFIWGARLPHKPAPWFADIEVTVQGRRHLRDAR